MENIFKKKRKRKGKPTQIFLPEKFHGERSLAGYSPWDHRVEYD